MYSQQGSDLIPPAVKNILLATAAVFLFQEFIAYNLNDMLVWFLPDTYQGLRNASPGYITAFDYLFGLVPSLVVGKFYIWQLATYMFLHGGFSHILINMFVLWMFGRELEGIWGSKEFLKYYFLTGTAAGATIFLWNLGSSVPTIGASGAVFGVLVAYALFFPDREIYVYFLFPVKAKYFVLFIGLLEFLWLPNQDGISHIGHLGGLVAGFFYLRQRYAHWGIGQNFFRGFFKKKDPF